MHPYLAGDEACGEECVRSAMSASIPEDVRNFLFQHIDSVEQLEVLLLLRMHADRGWSPEEVATELRTDARSVRERLDDLRGGGLLAAEPEGGLRYAPKSPALDRTVHAVAQCYETHRVAIITLIFSKPSDRIRSFADAFRLRKEEDDG
jgi:hypothetical protein